MRGRRVPVSRLVPRLRARTAKPRPTMKRNSIAAKLAPRAKGFASLHPDRRRQISAQGGRTLHAQRGSAYMSRIGRRGGKA